MSARRPGITRDLSYEEAAAVAGVDPDLSKIFDEHTKPAGGEERGTLFGRRVTLVITRESAVEAPMTDTVIGALIRYCGVLLAGGAGRDAKESFVFKRTTGDVEPVTLTVVAESYELEKTNDQQ